MHDEIIARVESGDGSFHGHDVAVTASGSEGRSEYRDDMLMHVELDRSQTDSIVRAVQGGASNIKDMYPLSPLQEGMLFHRLLNERSDTYVLSTLFELQTRAELEALAKALQSVINRHDVLRTAVFWENLPRPVQVVYRHASLPIRELMLGEGQDVIQQLKEWMRPGRVSLDLHSAPIGHLLIAAGPQGKWYALLQLHHLICDHRSLGVVVEEAGALLEGREQELPAPVPYRRYVAHALGHVRAETAAVFFRSKLAQVDEPTAPFGLLDVHGDGSRIEEAGCMLDSDLARRIRLQASSIGVSAARLFHSAWSVVVARTSGRDDPVFGTVVLASQQRSAQTQRVVGMSVNTLPLRLQLQGLSAKQLVEHTHTELRELLGHEHVPLTLARSCSGVAGNAPLFTSLLNYRHSARDLSLGRNRTSAVRVLARGEAWTNYPLTLLVDDFSDGFLLTAQTDRRLPPMRLIGHVQAAMQSLLEALQSAPQTPALLLSILPAYERHQVLEAFNATATPYDSSKLMHELFEEQVERTPAAVAVWCENESLTYADLNSRANQLARGLRSRGIGPDQLVAVCIERSLQMVVGLLGVLKAGAAYVPIDPTYPSERLEYMLQDAAPKLLLTQKHLKSKLPSSTAAVVALDTEWDEIAVHDARNLSPVELSLRSNHLAYVIYTSGSTGKPKGAMNEHRALINRLQWMQDSYKLGPSDSVLQKTPFSFDVSVWEFFWTLAVGARLVMARPQGHQDPTYLRELIEQTGVTTLHFVPSMLQVFLDQHIDGSCPSLRRIICSGEELSSALQNRCLRCFPGTRLANLYGPTEAAIDVTAWECRPHEDSTRVPIGHPISNIRMYVLDPRREPVPVGAVGEIYIGGVGVGRGYLNRPDLTSERFLSDPFISDTQARVYKTGDLGRWRADGAIEYLGRNDYQVKIRGLRIELGEIDAQLSRHEAVKDAVVLAREDAVGERRLVAYVTRRDRAPLRVEELRTYLKAALPEYMVPSAFVVLERMPLSANGKLDRKALPAPAYEAYGSKEYEAPQDAVEEIVAGVWRALLGIPQVGRRDNFFELGGHSLLIVQMLERLRRLGLTADVRRVFDSPTLAGLASTLKSGSVEGFDVPANRIPPECDRVTPEMLSLVELEEQHIESIAQLVCGGMSNIQDVYPLTPLQEGILFHHLLERTAGDTYVLPTLLSVASIERVNDLIAAVQAAIDRHDVLRTAVLWEELPRPVQVVYRRATLLLEEIALDPDREPADQANEWLKPEGQCVDLRRAPLVWMRTAQDKVSGQWYVLLRLHHITIDHVTAEVVTSEIVDHLEGRTERPPASGAYRTHVAQALAYASTSDAEAFFRRKLGDVDEPTAPFGLLDVYGDGTQIDTAHEALDAECARRVRWQARRLGLSPATLFHAAWALVVAHTSGRDDVVFGSVLLGRLQGSAGGQRILGMFINTLPLRLQLAGITAQQLVEQTQRELIELLGHEQASLAMAQRCSSIGGSAPLFSALLNYRHHTPDAAAEWSGARGIRMLAGQEWTSYPLTVSVDDLGEGFKLTAQTDRRIHASRVTRYLSTALGSLLEALEHMPQRDALSLPILPEAERRELLESFNATAAPLPLHKAVHHLFEQQVERTPTVVAVEHRELYLTYGDLNRKANQLARYLRRKGAGPGQLVGICMERSLDLVVGLLAILKADAAYVPLDPNYPQERLRCMLVDAAPKCILTQRALRSSLSDISIEVIEFEDASDVIAAYDYTNLSLAELGGTAPDLVYLIFTSGSTGTPKGTAMPHSAMVNLLDWHRVYLPSSGQRVLQFAALSFDVAFQDTFSTLCGGGTLVLPDECVRRDAEALAQLLSDRDVNRLFVPPLMLQAIAQSFKLAGIPLTHLKDVITAGEQLSITPDIVAMFEHLPECRLHNHYGPTETHVVTALTLAGEPHTWPAFPSIGGPISNTQMYVLDSRMQPVPIDVVGELYIGGANVAHGYLNQPELTRARFVKNPFVAAPEARLYKTGDLGRWQAHGQIEYLGRNDHQVKIRGYRIELGEIEAQLARHPEVGEAAVVAREDVPGQKRLVAYAAPRGSKWPSTEALRAHLRSVLPEYMVPSAVVVLEELPLTPSGKLDRRALPEPQLGAYSTCRYEAPEGEVEQALARIWEEVLQIERVGREDDFFDLGGHSLLAVQVASRIQSALSVDMPIRRLFTHSMLKQLAVEVSAIRRVWLIEQIELGGVELEQLLGDVTSMPEGTARELRRKLVTGETQ